MFTPTMQLSVHVKEVESMIKAGFFGGLGGAGGFILRCARWWMFYFDLYNSTRLKQTEIVSPCQANNDSSSDGLSRNMGYRMLYTTPFVSFLLNRQIQPWIASSSCWVLLDLIHARKNRDLHKTLLLAWHCPFSTYEKFWGTAKGVAKSIAFYKRCTAFTKWFANKHINIKTIQHISAHILTFLGASNNLQKNAKHTKETNMIYKEDTK